MGSSRKRDFDINLTTKYLVEGKSPDYKSINAALAELAKEGERLDAAQRQQGRTQSELKERYTVSETSLRRMEQAYADAGLTVSRVAMAEQEATTATERQTQALLKQQVAVSDLATEQEYLRNSILSDIGTGTSGGGRSRLSTSSITSAQQLLRGAGAGGAADIIGVADDVGRLTGEFRNMAGVVTPLTAAVGGLAGGALIALSLAIKNFTDQMQEQRKRLEDAVNRQLDYNRLIVNGISTEDANERAAAAAREADALTRTIRDLEAAGEGATGWLGELVKAHGGYSEALSDLREQQSAAITELNLYNRVRTDGTTADTDARIAAEALVEAERELAEQRQRNIDAAQLGQLQTRLQAQNLNSDQIEDRIAAIRREQQITREFIDTSQLSAEAVDGLNLKLNQLEIEAQELTSALPAARLRAIGNSLRDGLGGGIESLTGIVERAAERVQAIRDIYRDLADDLNDLKRRVNDRIARVEDNRDFRAGELDRTRQLAILENERKAGLARQKAAEDARNGIIEAEQRLARERVQILKDFSVDFFNAVARRDALAGFLAQQRARQEQAEAARQEQEDKQQIQQRLQEQNRAIDDALREQNRAVQNRYNEQLRTLNINAQRQIDLERQKLQSEYNLKVQAAQAEVAALNQFAQSGVNSLNQFASAGASILSGLAGQAGNIVGSYNTNVSPAFNIAVTNNTTPASTGLASVRREIDRRLNEVISEAERQQRTYSFGR